MENLPNLDAYFREYGEISKRFRNQLSAALEAQKTLRQSMRSTIEVYNSFRKIAEPVFVQQESHENLLKLIRIPSIEDSNLFQFENCTAEIQKSIQQLVAPAFEQLQRAFRELPQRTQEALLLIGEKGWYWVDIPNPIFWQLKFILEEGDEIEAEKILVEYFENHLSEIEQSITQGFPHREHLIKSAFNAHSRQEYELSIPVFLAQSDGICKELFQGYLFTSKDKKPCTATYIEQIAVDTYTAALLSPLTKTLPISASERDRSEGFTALNRHMVLHGESLNYGSKTNSLKTISLLNYVAHIHKVEK